MAVVESSSNKNSSFGDGAVVVAAEEKLSFCSMDVIDSGDDEESRLDGWMVVGIVAIPTPAIQHEDCGSGSRNFFH